MSDLTAQDIERMCREMIERFYAVNEPSEALIGAEMGRIVAEYPPAVGWCYLLLTLNDLLRGRKSTTTVRGRRR